MRRTPVAIVGSGNIGTDLLEKLRHSTNLEVIAMVGVDPSSAGLARARSYGIDASTDGVDWLLNRVDLPTIVFEATSASVHARNAPHYRDAGIRAVDLTPAARGPFVIPPVNLREHLDAPNINMVTCGGQATVPMVYAVARVQPVGYAEIVATVSSASAGPGTRANIDEFTQATARCVKSVGGALRGKAIIILNPAEPPLIMRDTIFCALPENADRGAVTRSVLDMEREVQTYVPGYRLLREPQFDDEKVTLFLEVQGAGDFLPTYAGNLDIMTAAAARVGDELARSLTGARG